MYVEVKSMVVCVKWCDIWKLCRYDVMWWNRMASSRIFQNHIPICVLSTDVVTTNVHHGQSIGRSDSYMQHNVLWNKQVDSVCIVIVRSHHVYHPTSPCARLACLALLCFKANQEHTALLLYAIANVNVNVNQMAQLKSYLGGHNNCQASFRIYPPILYIHT